LKSLLLDPAVGINIFFLAYGAGLTLCSRSSFIFPSIIPPLYQYPYIAGIPLPFQTADPLYIFFPPTPFRFVACHFCFTVSSPNFAMSICSAIPPLRASFLGPSLEQLFSLVLTQRSSPFAKQQLIPQSPHLLNHALIFTFTSF